MRTKLILLAAIGMMAAQDSFGQYSLTIKSAKGGVKMVSHVTEWKAPKDDTLTLDLGWRAVSDPTAFNPIYSYTLIGTDSLKTLSDTVTDAESWGGLVGGTQYLVFRLMTKSGTTVATRTSPAIEVLDSIFHPALSVVSKNVDSAGRLTLYVQYKANDSTTITSYLASDPTKVYRPLVQKATQTVTASGVLKIDFGILPENTALYMGVKAVNAAWADSIVPVLSDRYVKPMPATGEIEEVLEKTDATVKLRLNVVGYKLKTYQVMRYRVKGASAWAYRPDTASFSGDSLQHSTWTVAGLQSNTAYEFQAYTWNSKGGTNSIVLEARTEVAISQSELTGHLDTVYAKGNRAAQAILRWTLEANSTANAFPIYSRSSSFADPIGGDMQTLTGSAGSTAFDIAFPDTGIWYVYVKLVSNGTEILSNILSIAIKDADPTPAASIAIDNVLSNYFMNTKIKFSWTGIPAGANAMATPQWDEDTSFLFMYNAQSVGTNAASGTLGATVNFGMPGTYYVRMMLWISDGTVRYSTPVKVVATTTTAIGEIGGKPAVTAYPNPATDYLSFSHSGTLSVYDIAGKKIIKEAISAGSSISVSQYPRGIYFYELDGATGKIVLK